MFFGFLKFPNWHLLFFGFLWFFLVSLALVLARIRNWKLFFGFFWFFFFGFFFGIGLGQHSKLKTGYLGSFVFFWFFWFFLGFFVFLVFEFRVRILSPKKQKKNKKKQKNKKPVATPKLVNWLVFFFGFF